MARSKTTAPQQEEPREITRYGVLCECLDFYNGLKRAFSQNGAFQQPKLGYEAAFDAVEKKITILREMINEAR